MFKIGYKDEKKRQERKNLPEWGVLDLHRRSPPLMESHEEEEEKEEMRERERLEEYFDRIRIKVRRIFSLSLSLFSGEYFLKELQSTCWYLPNIKLLVYLGHQVQVLATCNGMTYIKRTLRNNKIDLINSRYFVTNIYNTPLKKLISSVHILY